MSKVQLDYSRDKADKIGDYTLLGILWALALVSFLFRGYGATLVYLVGVSVGYLRGQSFSASFLMGMLGFNLKKEDDIQK